ncbi:hypothetical protein THAPSDRAFT_261387 [Thalassiosira pseudonana CCMP1335]|uniref:ATP synthase mitochondrial F1 complex assembly factor 1 n=1 Tax=Thalassiosira pseudonana TaxID=35128 RepID=B8BUG9_THAPS|nr:hypothetical protein THAPSDRAFT_261387 [Thalassiosira pseudonana CCMP1335]EED94756.1 hypothetical protein THAPSDRAFT_261387 [Thalassiosira pseudonana CCMP1335]
MSSAAPIRIHTHTSRLLSSASIDSTRRPPGIRFVKPHDVHHRRPSTISSPPFVTTSSLQIRSNFSYAGPRKLQDILKTELIEGKTKSEIQDLWLTYHEGKEKIHGLSLDGAKAKTVLSRAAQCPFFIHPVFRDEGHFMIVSQFQAPNHFLLAFLEDYQMDPSRAQPLLTVSVFDDLADSKDLALVRCDIINQGIEEDEGYKLCQCLLGDYSDEDDFRLVHLFNKKPDAFNVDEYLKEREKSWK